jgi:hypothetical protein
VSFKHVRNTYFFINAIRKACQSYMWIVGNSLQTGL